jgi:prepilin-type N-terminal cleavage/methylation domain-containing protein
MRNQRITHPPRTHSGFTMIEVAISLAIIGFALVAIIGVLPYGMNTQRDNREETIINQDATLLMEAIRTGAYQSDDLTNSIYAITNYWTLFNADGSIQKSDYNGYDRQSARAYGNSLPKMALFSGTNIVGLLSTPEFTDTVTGAAIADPVGRSYYSNRVFAYVRSISGLAADRPPQDNDIMRDDAFTYRILVMNSPVPQNTNQPFNGFTRQLAANQREIRLLFSWPVQPNGSIGGNRQNYRATVAGRLTETNFYGAQGHSLYFYRPQSFQAQ